jgi:hypothetical protein
MAGDSEKTFRPWIAWLIGGIWAGIAVAVLIAARIHPATTANLSISTRRVSFRTSASHILGPSNEEQLLISGVSSLQIRFNHELTIRRSGAAIKVISLEAKGDSFTSCSFYQVRSSGFEVRGPAVITLEVVDVSNARSFSLRAHGLLNDELSSLPGEHGLQPGFECRGLRIGGGPPGDVEGNFSPGGGDTIFVATSLDSRLDFSLAGHSEVSDTQIPILGELRFSEIDPGTSEEKSVLLKPDTEITFEKADKKITVDSGDLLVIVPQKNFYMRQFTVKNGIHLSLHGSVREIRAGAGVHALSTLLPSAFEQMQSGMRLWGAIVGGVGLLIGILERMGVLGKK